MTRLLNTLFLLLLLAASSFLPVACATSDTPVVGGESALQSLVGANQACFKCNGSGKFHDHIGSDPSYPNCGHFKTCNGCSGSGIIAATATKCPKCNGGGKFHDHIGSDPSYPNCGHFKDCPTCKTKGWV